MFRIVTLTSLLIAGLVLSQVAPASIGTLPDWFNLLRQFLMMSLLAYIMIEVGREFELGKASKKEYAIDYGVAATAAAFPWLLCTGYFLIFLMPETSDTGRPGWVEALLAGRFAAPTSAGVLFSMLAAAGLAGTWAYNKTRILAIFDDLDTVLLMIPLTVLIVGMAWQLGLVLAILALCLFAGWRFYHRVDWPTTWPWVLFYSISLAFISETLYYFTKDPQTKVGAHIEVLLPAFLLGCALKPHAGESVAIPGEDEPGMAPEEKAGLIISGAFMLLVGLSMPSAFGPGAAVKLDMSLGEVAIHVLIVTVLANIGKMFAVLCYRNQATFKERLAVSVALFPRGEVGAGVLAVSLSYGIKGPFVTVGFLSLALNLILTGAFILIVKRLLATPEEKEPKVAGLARSKEESYAH